MGVRPKELVYVRVYDHAAALFIVGVAIGWYMPAVYNTVTTLSVLNDTNNITWNRMDNAHMISLVTYCWGACAGRVENGYVTPGQTTWLTHLLLCPGNVTVDQLGQIVRGDNGNFPAAVAYAQRIGCVQLSGQDHTNTVKMKNYTVLWI